MDMTPGAVSPCVNRGAPQSQQKLRVARLPLPARTEYVFGVPVICVSDTRTMTPEAKGAPLETETRRNDNWVKVIPSQSAA